MKKNGFLLIGLAAILCVLVGGAYKHTALRDKRVELTYRYDVSYTVEVPDVDPASADMFIERMGLYLDSKTVVGSVKKVGRAPAASGKEGYQDLTLTVSATGARLSETPYGSYALTEHNQCHFLSRMIDFDGYVTYVEEE